ncbi:MAG: DUF1559 domain-containing protein [Armatimonadota bacterium]
MRFTRDGFTLIELLVVIAIIAILAAILFPVFARAREKARQTACLSNVKQIALATQMYAQDHGEMLPQGGYWSPDGEMMEWYDVLEPYLRNEQILLCPSSSERNPKTWNYGFVRQTTGYQGSLGSFEHPDGSTISPGSAPVALARVNNPSEKVLISDAHNFYTELAFWYRTDSPYDEVGGAYYWVDGRHNGGANLGFMDGHAKWFASTSPYGPDHPNVAAGPLEYYYLD